MFGAFGCAHVSLPGSPAWTALSITPPLPPRPLGLALVGAGNGRHCAIRRGEGGGRRCCRDRRDPALATAAGGGLPPPSPQPRRRRERARSRPHRCCPGTGALPPPPPPPPAHRRLTWRCGYARFGAAVDSRTMSFACSSVSVSGLFGCAMRSSRSSTAQLPNNSRSTFTVVIGGVAMRDK